MNPYEFKLKLKFEFEANRPKNKPKLHWKSSSGGKINLNYNHTRGWPAKRFLYKFSIRYPRQKLRPQTYQETWDTIILSEINLTELKSLAMRTNL